MSNVNSNTMLCTIVQFICTCYRVFVHHMLCAGYSIQEPIQQCSVWYVFTELLCDSQSVGSSGYDGKLNAVQVNLLLRMLSSGCLS